MDEDQLLEHNESLAVYHHLNNNFSTNPKKVMKMVKKMFLDTSIRDTLRNGIIYDVMTARDPVKVLRHQLKKAIELPLLIKELAEQGKHGIILINDTVHPCELDTRSNWLTEGKRWDEEQERLIMHELANGWMREHDKGYFHGEVILFKQFGFTGIPREIEMRCIKDTSGLTRHPGTNFFTN